MSKILVASFCFAGAELYCPDEGSWYGVDGKSTSWNGDGWTVNGGGGVHGKTSFNLLGGYVEFDVDNSGSKWGVNNNFYTISPDHAYTNYNDYCDGQGPDASSPLGIYCMEMDIYEANGAQNLATTWHNWFNHNGDCDQGGCGADANVGGRFHVKAEFGSDGWMHTYFNGNEINSFNPYPSDAARDNVKNTMSSVGVTFASTQWTGWVPGPGNVKGDLDNSQFSITNMRVSGSVVFGPEPPKCAPAPAPQPAPSPSPSPTPTEPCGCSWTQQYGCDDDDGSRCYVYCCKDDHCDCSWTQKWGCGNEDGTYCYSQCCSGLGSNGTEVAV